MVDFVLKILSKLTKMLPYMNKISSFAPIQLATRSMKKKLRQKNPTTQNRPYSKTKNHKTVKIGVASVSEHCASSGTKNSYSPQFSNNSE